MSVCVLSLNQLRGCRESIGGDSQFFIAKREDIDIANITVDGNGLITLIPPTVALATPLFLFEQRQEASSTTTTITASEENGTVFYETDIVFALYKRQQETRNEIKALAALGAFIIEQDNNGEFIVYGTERDVILDTGTIMSGQAFGDKNGYDVTMKAKESIPGVHTTLAAFSAILNP